MSLPWILIDFILEEDNLEMAEYAITDIHNVFQPY